MEAIAIVGAACRLPGAENLEAFWSLLQHGTDAVSVVPANRFTQARFLHPKSADGGIEPGTSYTFAAGVVDDIDLFDPAAFGLSPREAQEMDPQQRLLLEVARAAIEDAGWSADGLSGTQTGVFVGASSTDFWANRYQDSASMDRYGMTGGAMSIIANRVAHVFDLRGAAQTIDTACSSSLVALHLACEELRSGRLSAALVGGVNMLLAPFSFVGFSRASMLSPTGRCHAFSSDADGYVRAEGAGVVIVKRLSDALADGDAIRAVIRGTGTNSAGRTVGLSLPNSAAQAALLRHVLARSGLSPAQFGYFEAHGTGTLVGDPAEASAIGDAIAQRVERDGQVKLPIGSVKTNIGHLESASGIAGLLKAMLVLQHRQIPASLHCASPNATIPFDTLRLEVAAAARPLDARDDVAVGVNSFGFGGTNGTALLTVAPTPVARRVGRSNTVLPPLLLSAHAQPALRALAALWDARLAETSETALPALLRAAAHYRDLQSQRLVLRGTDGDTLRRALADWLAGNGVAGRATEGTAARTNPASTGVVFVFSGNGAQMPAMAQQAARHNARFRAALTKVDAALAPLLGWSPKRKIIAGVTEEDLVGTDMAQPLLFATQVAIVETLRGAGIEADLCLGHSVGEVASAWCAGLLDLPTAARLIVVRSSQQHRLRGQGRMAALGCAIEDALPALVEASVGLPGPPLEIAAENGPRAVTVAGPLTMLDRLATIAAARRWSYLALDLDYAFHSASMDPVADALVRELADMKVRPARTPMISTVTTARLDEAGCTPDYWWHNLRDRVRFRGAVHAASAGARLFIEIGGTPILQSYIRETLLGAGSEARLAVTLSKRDGGGDPFPAIIDRAIAQGADPRSAATFTGPSDPRVLPLTPFNRTPVTLARTSDAITIVAPSHDHRLLGFRSPEHPNSWVRRIDAQLEPWLADHRFAGAAVLPAAAMAEMALAAAGLHWPDAAVLEVSELRLLRMLPIPDGRGQDMRLHRSEDGRITLSSRPHLSDEDWTDHALGQIGALSMILAPEPSAFVTRRVISGADIVALAARIGLEYGPAFCPVVSADLDPEHDRAVVHLALPQDAPGDDGFVLHPVRLDGALQGLIALLAEGASGFLGAGMVPSHIGRLLVRRNAPAPVVAEIHVRRRGTRSVVADMVLRDAAGGVVARAWDCWMQRVPLAHGGAEADPAFHFDLVPALTGVMRVDGLAATALRAASAAVDAAPANAEAMAEAAELLRGCVLAAAFAAFSGLEDRPLRTQYAAELMSALAETGLASADPASRSGWRLVDDPDLPDAGEIWRGIYAEHPDLAPELAWVAAAIERLPALLASAGWGDDGTAGAADIAPLPVEAASHRRMAATLTDAAIAFAAAWPMEIPLRVLDLGGRPDLGALLAATGRRIVHVAVHVTGDAGERGAAKSAGGAQSGALETVKLVWDPSVEGAALPSSDLVVGIGAGLRFGPGLLPAARQALNEGGGLLLVEPVAALAWTFVAGQDPTWWDGLGTDGAGLLDSADWARMLAAQGFSEIEPRVLAGLALPAALISACAGPATAGAAATVGMRPDLPQAVLLARPGALRTALQARFAAHHWPCRVMDFNTHPDPELLRGRLVIAVPPADLGAGVGLPRALAAISDIALACVDRAEAMVLVTEGGMQPGAGPHVPAATACLGLARVLVNECAPLRLRRIDLCPGLPAAETAERMIAELLGQDDSEAEVALTASGRMVPRMRRGLPSVPRTGPRRLVIGHPGQLGTLAWEPMATGDAVLAKGEVRIRIAATGLNFRDVMWAQALLPEDVLMDGFAGPTLGMEAAGTVIAVGPEVDFAVGDQVFGFVAGGFASRAVVRAEAITRRPATVTAIQAATIPVTFMTAVYALETCARLRSGERVLIHAGTGGVGLAAIQVAKAAGAEIAATAGTPAKRAFLRQLGVDLVLDSRDLGFADALREAWPDGVDVVLNSLAGGFMDRSLALVRPFGRFVEIGKRDFVENRFTSLRPMRQNVTYFAVDVDQLPRARPAIAAQMLADISARLEDGTFQPLPATMFGHDDVEVAFRMLQAATHMGKIVVVPPHDAPASDDSAELNRSGTVVIIGGVQGFGLATARFLARNGTKHLALLSRQGAATAGAVAALGELAALGATARAYGCDAADANALAATLATVRAEQKPIVGVIHAAAVLDDGAAASMTADRFAPVLAAKLAIAENLDRLTAEDDLAFFVMYSSATTAVGNPGQANYVAANAALEALARRRRAAGRPALAIGWGPIADVGILARDSDTAQTLKRRIGASAMPADRALAGLPRLLASATGTAVVHYARLDWGQLAGVLPVLAEDAFGILRNGATTSALGGRDMLERLRAGSGAEATTLLRGLVREEVARILQLGAANAADLAIDVPLPRLGLDSLGGMELRGALEARLGIPVPLASVSDTLTIEALVLRIRDAAIGQSSDVALQVMLEKHEGNLIGEPAAVQHVEAGE